MTLRQTITNSKAPAWWHFEREREKERERKRERELERERERAALFRFHAGEQAKMTVQGGRHLSMTSHQIILFGTTSVHGPGGYS